MAETKKKEFYVVVVLMIYLEVGPFWCQIVNFGQFVDILSNIFVLSKIFVPYFIRRIK
jgi:hypothetical protein